MTLQDVIENLSSFPREHAIYAALVDGGWRLESPAVVQEEPEDEELTQTFDNIQMEYLLEIFLARDIIEVWERWNNARGSNEQKLAALIYYRTFDAYMPIEP